MRSVWVLRHANQVQYVEPQEDHMTKLVVACRNIANAPKTSQLMLYREITAVCSQIHTKHINTLCGQNVEFFNVHIVTTGL